MPNDFDPPLGKYGGARAGAGRPKRGERREQKIQSDNTGDRVTLNSRGNSVAYTIARLRRDNRHDLVEAIHNRETSAFAVGVLMGWKRRPATVHGARRQRFDVRTLIG